MSVLSAPHFHDEAEAYKFVESILWPKGPVCPRCGETKRIGDLKGKSTRLGVRKCYKCRKPFNVKVNSIFEGSNLPMHKWLQAIHLLCASKKGISSHQLARMLDIQVRSAWFLSHRIREAMRVGGLRPPMGDGGNHIEADETYFGDNKRYKNFKHKKVAHHGKHTILTLVERGGEARSFHVERTDARSILPIVQENLAKEAKLNTDTGGHYRHLQKTRENHEMVNHKAGEYVRGETHTNTVESYFSLFKRGMKGTYQHCSERHLCRYLAEFDFRHTHRAARGVDDRERALRAILGAPGKRLTYQKPDEGLIA